MKKIFLLLLMLLPTLLFADDSETQVILDKVAFQVSGKQWVKTESALLTVHLNATLKNADLVKVRADIMNRLGKIASGDWHITQFNRGQDNSGLEKLTVQAQARIQQAQLTNVYQNATSVSEPGAQYEIADIAFQPSLEEVQQVRSKLRETLYQQVNQEIAQLNRVYKNQHYSLFQLAFVEGNQAPESNVAQNRKFMSAMAMPAASALAVSNELVMTAIAQAASNRDLEK